jgi:DNA-directed RNA polymerase subunit N (RpoN/RPB10)
MPVEFWPRCTGCGDKIIGESIKEYVDEMIKIQKNTKLSPEEKELERSKLFVKLGIMSECCRLPLMGIVLFCDPNTGVV